RARQVVQLFREKAERAAQRALQINPQHPDGYWAMATLKAPAGEWATAEDFAKQGLALDPTHPDLLVTLSAILLKTGRPKESLAVMEKLLAIEPLVPAYNSGFGMEKQVAGLNDDAIALFESIPENERSGLTIDYLARAYAAVGLYAK